MNGRSEPRAARRPRGLWHTERVGVRFGVRAVVVAAALVVMAACAPAESPDAAYVRKVGEERARKDEFFRTGADSPVKAADHGTFLPLTYFDVDPAYAPPARLQLLEDRTPLVMPTSTGKLREMERVGYLEFTLKGATQKLTAFADAGTERVSRLFVPFSDLTSGTETYQAGRYMDIDPQSSGIYVVDFNLAYHPYCYYNPEYDCPFPPAENRLKTPVRAGERLRAAETLAPGR